MRDPQERPALAPYFNSIKARIYPVGRLDFGSEGLLLLTNDGDFAEKLTKSADVPRVYHLKVRGKPTQEMVERLARGGRIQNRLIKPFSVRISEELTSKSLIEIVMLGAVGDLKSYLELKGMTVDRIIRTSIGQITLRGLEPGKFRHLRKGQVDAATDQPELGMLEIKRELDKAAVLAQKRKVSDDRRALAHEEQAKRDTKAQRVIRPRAVRTDIPKPLSGAPKKRIAAR
jgi:pseudouridine synthase